MTITEFLLARIAEDEAEAVKSSDAPGTFLEVIRVGNEHDVLAIGPARVLAECEAKRQIVGMVVAADDGQAHPLTLQLGDAMLDALASVYAEHLDYDQAWK